MFSVMANFFIANDITTISEAGWVNNPLDGGGETYRGISRKWNGDWVGWLYIDYCKKFRGFPLNINHRVLDGAVNALYKRRYWNMIGGDLIPEQPVANELYDVAVNMGPPKTIRFLQEVLNLLNRNQKDYPDIAVDRKIGTATLSATLNLINKRGSYMLLLFFKAMKIHEWIRQATNNPSQEAFMNGWGNREIHNLEVFIKNEIGVPT